MLKDKVIEIFVPADDFCIEFKKHIDQFRLQSGQIKQRNREASFSDSEIISILIFFHFGSFTNFKHFYNHYVKHICRIVFQPLYPTTGLLNCNSG